MNLQRLKNHKIAILGFGLEGKSTLKFLQDIGVENITILDRNKIEENYSNIKVISGDNYLNKLGDFDLIIKSPGISTYNSKILPFRKKITSQTEIFLNNYDGKIIGITGTKGKSTISTLTYEILKSAGYKVKLVGNIGKPVLEQFKIENGNFKIKEDFIIYELSSYMLDNFVPKLFIGVLNNIFPDHMNWHNNSFDIYKQAKENILINSLNKIDGRKIELGKVFITKLKGKHNQKNINIVNKISNIIGISKNIFDKVLINFKSLPHRLEIIGTYKQIIFIDDAISTTPESTIEAIKTFGKNIGTIFLGGLDRGYSFKELVKNLNKYSIKNIVLFPESGLKIAKLLDNTFNILETKSMKKAVIFAFSYTKKGSICVLSTASPSYNLWKNYKEKGYKFKKEILTYKK